MNLQSLIVVILRLMALNFFLQAAVYVLESSAFFFYQWRQKRMVIRVLAANPHQLLSAGRKLLVSQSDYIGEISVFSPEIPSTIRRLKPRQISLTTNSLHMEFGDAANPFGLAVFTPDTDAAKFLGYGRHKGVDGVWLFDDGQLEKYGLPNGPVNGSQPIRSETNSTSSASGSRR